MNNDHRALRDKNDALSSDNNSLHPVTYKLKQRPDKRIIEKDFGAEEKRRTISIPKVSISH